MQTLLRAKFQRGGDEEKIRDKFTAGCTLNQKSASLAATQENT